MVEKLSEFIAADNITVNLLDGKPSPNVEKSKEVKIIKGGMIPEVFVPTFILYNRDYIANLKMKDSIPQLTPEQEKKYGVKFELPKPTTFKEVVDKAVGKYDLEKLKGKLAKAIKKYGKEGNDKFKEWCEKTFGEDLIDRRRSSDKIIVDILNLQDEGKL